MTLRSRLGIALCVLSIALLAAACQSETVPAPQAPVPVEKPDVEGVTDTEIRIGTWAPLTGPASPYGILAKSLEAYFAKINADGGIHGRTVNLIVRDDGYQPTRTLAAVKEMVEKDKVFCFASGVGTATGMAVRDFLDERKKVWVGPATGSSAWTDPVSKYRFAVYPTYTTEATLLTGYVVGQLKKTKLAIFYQNDAFGKEGVDGIKTAASAAGAEVIAEVAHEVTDTDLSSQALKLKQSGAEAVMLWSTTKAAATIVKECAKIKFKPQFASSSTVADPLMFALAGDAWNGTVLANWMPLPDEESPGMTWYREAIGTSESLKPGNFTMASMALAEPLVEALRRAGRELTNEKLIDALHSLKDFDGMFVQNVSFSETDHQGVESIYVMQARDGKYVRIADWLAMPASGAKTAEQESAEAKEAIGEAVKESGEAIGAAAGKAAAELKEDAKDAAAEAGKALDAAAEKAKEEIADAVAPDKDKEKEKDE
ncbi:ABC transporter substrate-binding protein [bacterium]|nr:ABC transporter substrate-binding protein [bacterium]